MNFLLLSIFIRRNALSTFHKIRRHLNSESRTSKGTGGSIKAVMNRPTYSSSQLSIEVSELHADENGRLEISCISTIPAKITPQLHTYPDFKSYSVKSEFKLPTWNSSFTPSLENLDEARWSESRTWFYCLRDIEYFAALLSTTRASEWEWTLPQKRPFLIRLTLTRMIKRMKMKATKNGGNFRNAIRHIHIDTQSARKPGFLLLSTLFVLQLMKVSFFSDK